MNIKITGKDLKATDAIKEYLEKKCERLQKYSETEVDVQATIKTEGINQVAELSANVNGDIYRAVTENKDLYASIDKDMDIIEGQIRKTKAKKDKQNMSDSIKAKEDIRFSKEDHKVENEILKTSYYDVKPISAEDAKLILSDKAKDSFMAFVNIDTGKVNVIFKLKDGKNFGLVEPEA